MPLRPWGASWQAGWAEGKTIQRAQLLSIFRLLRFGLGGGLRVESPQEKMIYRIICICFSCFDYGPVNMIVHVSLFT